LESAAHIMASLQDPNIVYALLAGPPVLGLLWSIKEWGAVAKIEIDGHAGKTVDAALNPMTEKQVSMLNEIAAIIQQGAKDFLFAEYTYMAVYIVIFTCILVGLVDKYTAIAFVVGSVTSIICGYIGMMIAVKTNVKCSHQCFLSLKDGFEVALQGGCVMGLSLVSIGVLALLALIAAFQKAGFADTDTQLYEAIAGYGLGGSSIALFGRVGGGIYTKAADVGADLSEE